MAYVGSYFTTCIAYVKDNNIYRTRAYASIAYAKRVARRKGPKAWLEHKEMPAEYTMNCLNCNRIYSILNSNSEFPMDWCSNKCQEETIKKANQ